MINREKEVTMISDQYFKSGEYPVVQDSIYDVKHGFINLDQLEVKILKDSIAIKITLVSLPRMLTFNPAALSMDQLNYNWELVFDLNADHMDSPGDISIGICKFKSDEEKIGPILSNTQQNIWKYVNNGANYLAGIADYVNIIGNSFVIVLPKNLREELKGITPVTNVYFKTYYNDGKTWGDDYFPSRK